MSTFTEISKKIGHDSPPLPLPTLRVALDLRQQVARRSKEAFEQVFRYHRFSPSATTDEESKIAHELYAAWLEGCRIFKD